MELSRNLRIERVARLEPTAALCLETNRTIHDAITMMRRVAVGCLLITEEQRLVGIFTERDLITRVLAEQLDFSRSIGLCMTPNPVSVEINEPIRNAILFMQRGGFRHLPVVDVERRPLGILSAKRVITWVVAHFPHLVHNLPPYPEQAKPHSREGA